MPGAIVVALVVLIYTVVLCLLLLAAGLVGRANAQAAKLNAEARLINLTSDSQEIPRKTGPRAVG
jgi:Flp pilus assembly protein protease CpaA